MVAIASLITSLMIVYSTVYSDADQRKHQSSVSLAFVWGIHRDRGPVNSPHKWPVTRKMFPFDDVIMAHVLASATAQLTHWGRVTHICVSRLDHHWLRCWLIAWSAPSHYLNQWRDIVDSNLSKLQSYFKRNLYIFIPEKAFENVICEMAANLSRPQCVKPRGNLQYGWIIAFILLMGM